MFTLLLRRLGQGLLTLLIAGTAVFVLLRVIPGDPAQMLVGDTGDPAVVAAMRAELGLDQPHWRQWVIWSSSVVRGDLGRSIMTDEPVHALILERFPVTATVVILAVAIAALLGIPAGMWAALRQGRATDYVLVGVTSVLLSVPTFWSGLIVLVVFAVTLGWLPAVGYVPLTENLHAGLLAIVMPVGVLAMAELATLARMMRSSTLEVLRLDYVASAHARGLSPWVILRRHVFRNAFAPTLTALGLMLGHLLGGVVVIEKIFGLPGIGRLLVDAIVQRDYPVVQGCLLFTAFLFVTINTLVDMLYAVLDPRVRV